TTLGPNAGTGHDAFVSPSTTASGPAMSATFRAYLTGKLAPFGSRSKRSIVRSTLIYVLNARMAPTDTAGIQRAPFARAEARGPSGALTRKSSHTTATCR